MKAHTLTLTHGYSETGSIEDTRASKPADPMVEHFWSSVVERNSQYVLRARTLLRVLFRFPIVFESTPVVLGNICLGYRTSGLFN